MSEITDRMVKYPFFEESKEALQDISPAEILNDTDVLYRAKQRIVTGANSETISSSQYSNDVELRSYPLARILVSILDEPYITKKYARAEAKTALANFKEDLEQEEETEDISTYGVTSTTTVSLDDVKTEFNLTFEPLDTPKPLVQSSLFAEKWSNFSDEEKKQVIESFGVESSPEDMYISSDSLYDNLASRITGFQQAERTDGYYLLGFNDFITNASELEESRWNLSNRILFDGQVLVTKGELLELIQQVFYDRIYENLPLSISQEIKDELEQDVKDLEYVSELEDLFFEDIDTVEEGAFPPVIDTILQRVRNGKNVIHEERITLATFLIHIGMSDDEIIEMLQVNSNFDEETRYQLQHLRTKGDGGEAYTPPTYSTLKAWGIDWEEDALEQEVKHPLTYYRIKLDEEEDEDENEEKQEENNEGTENDE